MTLPSGWPAGPFDGDKLREECGVFGIFGASDAAAHCALGLHALQHRGQEAAGITSYDGHEFHNQKALGLVADIFTSEHMMVKLKGQQAIGHVRYSTTGETILQNCHPFYAEFSSGGFAVAHNGNITNSQHLKRKLVSQGAIFQSTSDTEVIIHLIATSRKGTIAERFIDALKQVEGAYSLVALSEDSLMGVRDALGVRPLVLGDLDGKYVLASETVALDIIGASYIRDIEPGELVIITKDGIRSEKPFPHQTPRPCLFEHIYFARPDSLSDGRSIYEIRKKIGAQLAKEYPAVADIVVPVPESGIPAALGYSNASNIPFELGIIQNRFVGRTFIEPTEQIRNFGVKLKHNANRWQIDGKRIILVDDSIVRGTTSKKIVSMLRDAGAREIHMRIAAPAIRYSCFYGVDTPERNKLMAATMEAEEMANFIGADSLEFISLDGLYEAVSPAPTSNSAASPCHYCDACFTGKYPTELTDNQNNLHEYRRPDLAIVTGR